MRAQQNMLESVCRCVHTMWDVSPHSPWALSPQRTEDTESWDQLYGVGALRTESNHVLQQNSSSSFHFLILINYYYFFFLKNAHLPVGRPQLGAAGARSALPHREQRGQPAPRRDEPPQQPHGTWGGILSMSPSMEQLPPGLGTHGCPPAQPHASTQGSGAGGTPPPSP